MWLSIAKANLQHQNWQAMKKSTVLLFVILITVIHVNADDNTLTSMSEKEKTKQYDLYLRITGAGAVTSQPTGINCKPSCFIMADSGSVIMLFAKPQAGFKFSGWMSPGNGYSASPSYGVIMFRSQFVEAVFVEIDEDHDHVGLLRDCDDKNPTIFQSAFVYVDADGDGYDGGQITLCYGSVLPKGYSLSSSGKDCDDTKPSINPTTIWYLDKDADGFAVSTVQGCESPGVKYTPSPLPIGDCNDDDSAVHQSKPYYIDSDHDGYGRGPTVLLCSNSVPPNYSVIDGDCDDTNAGVHNNFIYYRDADNDGFGNSFEAATVCSENAPRGYVLNNVDCDDAKLLYEDNDGDGYGSGSPISCGIEKKGDCNDANAAIHPGASDLCNGMDDNCNGTVDEHCQITIPANADSIINSSGNTIIVNYRQIKINIQSANNLDIVVSQTPINTIVAKDTSSKYPINGKSQSVSNSLLLTIGIPNQPGKVQENEQFTIQLIPSSNHRVKQKK
jgi:hypothetical protein